MSRGRDEEELLGAAGDVTDGVWVHDNGASTQVEDFDQFDQVDVDENPFMPQVVDNDGVPGFRPFARAANAFEAGIRADIAGDEVLGDELAARIQQRDEATIGYGGQPVSDLAQLAQVQEIERAENRKAAPPVQINPETAVVALLGGSEEISVGKLVEVGRWTGKSIEACPVTVGFGQVSPVPTVFGGVPTAIFRPFGVVQYGTRNGPVSFEVDIGIGTQFTIGASSVNILVGLEDTTLAPLSAPTGLMSLAGQLSFYAVTHVMPVTRTLYWDSDGVTSTVTRAVPKYAKSLIVYREGNPTQQIDVVFFDSAQNEVYRITLAAGSFMTAPVSLSGDVYFVSLVAAAGFLRSSKMIFQLAI